MKLLKKIAVALTILIGGPVLGALIAFIISLPFGGGGGAPGDGILIMGFLLVSLVISIPTSILLAVNALRRSAKTGSPDPITE